jgi:hypothetical protein
VVELSTDNYASAPEDARVLWRKTNNKVGLVQVPQLHGMDAGRMPYRHGTTHPGAADAWYRMASL